MGASGQGMHSNCIDHQYETMYHEESYSAVKSDPRINTTNKSTVHEATSIISAERQGPRASCVGNQRSCTNTTKPIISHQLHYGKHSLSVQLFSSFIRGMNISLTIQNIKPMDNMKHFINKLLILLLLKPTVFVSLVFHDVRNRKYKR